ncbi:hypothetical protein [Gimesia panareensis]|uniref:Uncharacterized protein n=1 Tax=Gimesia panareensis TaxID=2527978 RepID=A0A517QD35_9PLAN|nr:hypothetical protein [Gimesia panareensis]QDT29531.1 hypothetical protein Enr10x_48860 [Gimesia panareensis]QDU52574.1 hypothetical protein Pan110_49540 [Gimesia panareensis]
MTNTAVAPQKNFYFTGLCILGIGVCLASWGWLYKMEKTTASEVVISTPIQVRSSDKSSTETSDDTVLTQITISNQTSASVRVVGFSARCVCIERLFELPRKLLPGEEIALDVNVHLPLPEGGTPAIVFVEQDQTVWKRKVQFKP